MYSSTLSLTSTLDGGGWLRSCPASFIPGNDPYPLYRRLSGTQEMSGWKILPPPGFDPWTVQPVDGLRHPGPSRYNVQCDSLIYCAVPGV
jgi:hypothetical protein